jgi:hypothetical protein
MRRAVTIVPVIVLSVSLGIPGWGQRNGFHLNAPLSLSTGQDEGFVADGQRLNDTVSILTAPDLALTAHDRRTRFSLSYQPEFEKFWRYHRQDSWNHLATLRLDYQIAPRWTLSGGDSFLSTQDASRQLADSPVLLPRGRLTENSADLGLTFHWSRKTTLGFQVDHTIITARLPGLARPDLLDQTGGAGTASWQRTLNAHHALSAGYSYLRFYPLHRQQDSPTPFRPWITHKLSLSYVWTVNPDLIFQFSGGGIRDPRYAYTAAAAVQKRLGGIWVKAGYERYLSFLGGTTRFGAAVPATPTFLEGPVPNALYQTFSARIYGNLTPRLGLDFRGLRGQNNTLVEGLALRSTSGRFRIHYRLTERLIAFVSCELYRQNANDFLQLPLSRQRYFGGLDIVLSKPTEARAIPAGNAAGAPDASEPGERTGERRREP